MVNYMKKTKKKRKFKYRILIYIFIMFLGYEFSFNIIMNYKLVSNNESFVKALLLDSNYSILYEKKEKNLFTKLFTKILDVNRPVSILDNVFHLKENKIKHNSQMAYVKNPNIENKQLDKEPEVFIYNTHQSETYEGKALEGYNITPGVMMASYIFQNKLATNNVKALVMEDNLLDYMNINNMNHSKSYQASRVFLKQYLDQNPNLKLILDIHRDSISKEKSTTIINNKSCVKILFVIGEENPNYENNLAMTNEINNKIKEKYSELTRGVITKGGKGNNGIYNQDLNPKITLIEIGSNQNTIDEVLNTIELLSPIIGEYING